VSASLSGCALLTMNSRILYAFAHTRGWAESGELLLPVWTVLEDEQQSTQAYFRVRKAESFGVRMTVLEAIRCTTYFQAQLLRASPQRWLIRTMAYSVGSAYDYRLRDGSTVKAYGCNASQVSIPLLALPIALGVYPVIAFYRGPMRRHRRRQGGLCIKCGYNLQGNVSQNCPECGATVANRQPEPGPEENESAT